MSITRVRWHYYIAGAIFILLGLLTLRYPLEAIMTVGFFMGIGLIATGLDYFSAYYFFGYKRFILLGLLDFIMGVYMTIQPGVTAFVVPFAVGIWLLVAGMSRICVSLWLGGAQVRGWWLMLIYGIGLIGMGVLMCVSPLTGAPAIMVLLSFDLIASGILAVIEGYMMFHE